MSEPDAELHRAQLRLEASRGQYNISWAPYLVPLLGAVLAIVFAAYALTRPSPALLLDEGRTPPVQPSAAPLEIELQ